MKTYQVTGMNCAACSARVEKAAASVKGADEVNVNLLTGVLRVEGSADPAAVIDAVMKAGYGCSLQKAENRKDGVLSETEPENVHAKTHRALKERLIRSLVFLLPLSYTAMGIAMLRMPAPSFLEGNHLGIALTELLLSTVVLFLNRSFFENGIKALLHGAPTMDTLVSMGSGISWIWSVIVIYQMTLLVSGSTQQAASPWQTTAAGLAADMNSLLHQLYFESAAMILVLITFGKMLEAKSKEKTTDALRSLRKLRPESARLVEGNATKNVPLTELKAGDLIMILPGETIPADGSVVSGISAVDESMLTGESRLIDKRPPEADKAEKAGKESAVYAATINKTGQLIVRVAAIGEDTALARIIHMVEDSAATKAPVQRLADKISSVFVPAVLCISLITFVVWLFCGASVSTALERSVSVLVISCPCALGLATPVAVMVAGGVGAKNGILFKNAQILEQCGRLKIAVFDKTGTLTKGSPAVVAAIPCAPVTESKLLEAAASVEAGSEHPIAESVLQYARERSVLPSETDGFTASGSSVSAVLRGRKILAGGSRLVQDVLKDQNSLSMLSDALREYEQQGLTIVYFAEDDRLLGAFALEDGLRENSADAILQLKELGVQPVLLSGDNEAAAAACAQKAGISEVHSGVLPGQKAEVISSLKNQGLTAMIGDGINDAVALKTADIGFAVAAGTDVAMDAADVVLMKSDLRDVAAAVRLSALTMKTIRQNLFWAFFYNVLCIPLAAGVFIKPFGISLNPMIGAACMGLSSLFVVTNALRLNLCDIYGGTNHTGDGRADSSDSNTESINNNTEPDAAPVCSCVMETQDDTGEMTDSEKEKDMLEIKVNGMMCPHCEKRVKEALEAITGVELAEASHEKGLVTVRGTADRKALIDAIKKAGYDVEE